jgi:hypothetical protein
MSTVRRLVIGLLATVGLLVAGAAAVPEANAVELPLNTFVVQLEAENEIPGCPAGVDSGAHGVAVVQINAETGEITYQVVAFRLPGTVFDAHIHAGAAGEANPPAQGFELTGLSTGVVAAGTVTNPELAAAILANPEGYYVNVHTTTCRPGAVRGQLG